MRVVSLILNIPTLGHSRSSYSVDMSLMIKRKIIIGLLSSAVALAIAPLTVHLYVRHKNDQAEVSARTELEAKWKNYLPDILKDRETISKQELFHVPASPHRDASELLNERFPWETGNTSSIAATWNKKHEKNHKGLDENPMKSLAKDRKYNEIPSSEIIEFATQMNFDKFDLSWAEQLKNYDHWRIDAHSPMRLEFEGNPQKWFGWVSLIPNYTAVQNAARTLLLKGIQERAFDKRAEQVRQLARLVLTHPHLVSQSVAAYLFTLEIDTREALQKSPRSAAYYGAQAKGPVSKEEALALKRYVWVHIESLNPLTPREIRKIMLSGHVSEIALCSAATERAEGFKLIQQYGSSEDRAVVEEILEWIRPQLDLCREFPSIVRLYDPEQTIEIDWNFGLHDESSWKENLVSYAVSLPLSERESVRYFTYVAIPSFFGPYHMLEEKRRGSIKD